MPLTPDQILEIQKIIETHHYAYVANTVGHDAVPEEVLADLEQRGLLNEESLDLVKQAYLYGQSLAAINDKSARTMSYNQFQNYIQKNPVPLTQMEQRAVAMAQVNAGQYCRGLGNVIEKDTGAILIEADQQLRIQIEDKIKNATAMNRAKRESISKLKSDLGWATQDWARDLERIAITETINAVQQGQADYLTDKYGPDSYVARIPNPGACKHCIRLHIGEDGQPRIFKLSTLENNGSNIGRKAADWRVVVGAIHPNCVCSLISVPKGWGFDDEGDLIPGGKLGIRYEEPKELELSLKNDFMKSLSETTRVTVQGIPIEVETREGDVRSWVSSDGSLGEIVMSGAAYGFVKNTTSMDEEELDVFVGPYPQAPMVYVIEQQNPDTGLYDEQKCMLGFRNEEHARSVYNDNYINGNDFVLVVEPMTIGHFKRWCGFELDKEWVKTDLGKALFVGPRGGKWADAAHTIPWKDEAKDTRKIAKKFYNDLHSYLNNRREYPFNSQGGITIPAKDFSDNDRMQDLVVLLVPKEQDSGIGKAGNTPVLVLNTMIKKYDSTDIGFRLDPSTVVHEITHYLDKGKGKGKAVSIDTLKDYFNHPSEFNAYTNEGLNNIEATVDRWKDRKEVIDMLFGDISNFESFRSNVIDRTAATFFSKHFLENLNESNKKKLDKKLYRWWDDNINNEVNKSSFIDDSGIAGHRAPGPNLGVNYYIPVPEKKDKKTGEGYELEVDDLLAEEPVPSSVYTHIEDYTFNDTIIPVHPLVIPKDVKEAHKDARDNKDNAKHITESEEKDNVAWEAANRVLEKGGPYIGPRGGKWADPQHTIPWGEESTKHQKPGTQLPKSIQDKLVELKIDKIPQASIPLSDIRVDFKGDINSKAVIAWKDAKGKWQAGYTPKFHENNAAKKWKRIKELKKSVSTTRKTLIDKLNTAEKGSKKHQGLTILSVIAETGLRPGSLKSVQSHEHYGISTLKKEHITFDGNDAILKFIGKAGKENTTIVQDKDVVKSLKYYVDNSTDDFLFNPNAIDVSKEVLPKGMKVKDFRTIKATEAAEKFISLVEEPPPLTGNTKKDKKLLAKALFDTSKKVSAILNNTPAIAKASYIHPQVFEQWANSIGAKEELWKV